MPKIDFSFAGTEKQFVNEYGLGVLDTLTLVKKIRFANSLLLVFAITIMTLMLLGEKGFWFSTIFILMLASNKTLITNGLKAHSEALFVFVFACGLVLLSQVAKKATILMLFLYRQVSAFWYQQS